MKNSRMSRRVLAVVLCLLLMLTIAPTAFAQEEITTESALLEAINKAEEDAVITIGSAGVTLTAPLVISNGRSITLTGGAITASDDFNTSTSNNMIAISTKGTSVTINCRVEAKASSSKQYRCILVYNGGKLILESGAYITGGYQSGGGVMVTKEGDSAAEFTMNGGKITGNTGAIGGGLSINKVRGSYVINGGTITGNTATRYAGGVWAGSEVELTMTGGTVTGNNVNPGDTDYENSADIMVNSNSSSKEEAGLTINGPVTANVWVECGDAGENGATGKLTVTSEGKLAGDIIVPDSTVEQVVDKIINQGSIEGDIALGKGTVLTNKGTVDGNIELAEGTKLINDKGTVTGNVAVNGEGAEIDNGTTGQITGEVTGNPSVPEGSENTITASAGANGTITPSGEVTVAQNAETTFTITPNAGYVVADVKIDGVSSGAVTSYTFDNVFKDYTIVASFTKDPKTITYPDYSENTQVDKEQDDTNTYTVICRNLNVRQGASALTEKVSMLHRGDTIKGVQKNGWVAFTQNGTTVYVSAEYVQLVGGESSSQLQVLCRTLNVRSGAGTSYSKIGKLSRNANIEVVDAQNGWYRIAYNGGYGYVSSAYVG